MHRTLERVFGARRGSFRSHVLVLLSGTVLSQAIPVALSPIITRLYSPTDLGTFALFSAAAAVLGVAATARYELAIMLPEDDRDAAGLTLLSSGIAVAIAAVGLVIVAAWVAWRRMRGEVSLPLWAIAVPASAGLTGLFQAFNYWTSRHKGYQTIATSRVAQTATTAGASLALAATGWGGGALVVASLLGQVAGTSVLFASALRRSRAMLTSIEPRRIGALARRFREFPKINLVHAATDALQSSGLIFILSAGFGGGIVGLYSLTLRVLTAPASLFGSAVSPVFYQRVAEVYRSDGDLVSLMWSILWRLAVLGLPVFAIIALWGPGLFSLVFGRRWAEAGTFARILLPWIAVNFVISPLSQVPVVLERQRTAFLFGLAYNAAILGPVALAAVMHWPVTVGLAGTSALAFLELFAFVSWTFHIARHARPARV